MIYLNAGEAASSGPLSLENVARIARPKNIPILVDAAAEVLTIPNVHLQQGATIVAYSGGKAICGPQCAGLLLGRKDLLHVGVAGQRAASRSGPRQQGRTRGDARHAGRRRGVGEARSRRRLEDLALAGSTPSANACPTIPGVKTTVQVPTGLSNKSPSLTISWDPAALHITGEDVAEELARTKPRIALGAGGRRSRRRDPATTSISVTAWMMQPGDDKIVADRIHARAVGEA